MPFDADAPRGPHSCAGSPHDAVATSIRHALLLGIDGRRALGLAAIFATRLTDVERAGLAYAMLMSMPEDDAYQVASLAIFGVWRGEAAA